ncbi:MAG: DUF4124 domain-containing protein [Polaromonas sp.]
MDFKLASKTLIVALAGGAFAISAFAQWQWIDKDGRKVFSDRSPPADIQDKNILKRPTGNTQTTTVPDSESTSASPAPAASAALRKASTPRLSGKDAQLEARKKQAEEEAAAKKKADEEKQAKSRAENCERAKKGLTGFQSGLRVFITNGKGEREVMDDNARAAETRRLQGIADSDCK